MEIKDGFQTVRTRHGTLTIDSVRDKKMAKVLARGEYPNESLIEMMRPFLNKESIVVDIGAHIGTFALPMASIAKNVVAFEPSPEAFSLLTRNAVENGVPLRLVNKALGSSKGGGTILVRNASNAGANTLVAGGDIPIATLDDEIAHADFIKIDVEGMELEVLRGGAQLLARARPVVLFEVNLSQLRAHGTSPRALERLFVGQGYQLYLPLGEGNGTLAHVRNLTLLTALIAPRAWLLWSDSAPFDLVAIPQERFLSLPRAKFAAALLYALKNNFLVKMHRLRAWLGYRPYGCSD